MEQIRINDKTQKVIDLRNSGLTIRAIAEVMEVSLAAVTNRLYSQNEEAQPLYVSKRMESEHIKNKTRKEELENRKKEVAEICEKVVKEKEERLKYYEQQRIEEVQAIKERFNFMYKK